MAFAMPVATWAGPHSTTSRACRARAHSRAAAAPRPSSLVLARHAHPHHLIPLNQHQRCSRCAPLVARASSSGGAGGEGDDERANFLENNPVGIELRSRLQATQLARQEKGEFDWQEVDGAYCRIPAGIPEGVVHFLGGALLGTFPQIAYDSLLKQVCEAGSFVVIATPYELDLDHRAIAREAEEKFDGALLQLQARYGLSPALPVYGVGHSLGGKLQALISTGAGGVGSVAQERAGNVFVSFNNFSAVDSVDLIDSICEELLERTPEVRASPQLQMVFRGLPQLARVAASWAQGAGMEFTPGPEETSDLIKRRYDHPRTRLIKFEDDKIDQSRELEGLLAAPCNGGTTSRADLPGNHLTPVFVRLDAGPLTQQLDRLGADTELRLGDEEGVKRLAMDVVGFLKGFS